MDCCSKLGSQRYECAFIFSERPEYERNGEEAEAFRTCNGYRDQIVGMLRTGVLNSLSINGHPS